MLSDFHKSILIIATLSLIAGLVIIGFLLYKSIYEESYPPIISECPDYWDVSYNNTTGSVNCVNTIQINNGSGTSNCMSYPTSEFQTNGDSLEEVLCKKYEWAKKCNIVWDGVTNNSKPCNDSIY